MIHTPHSSTNHLHNYLLGSTCRMNQIPSTICFDKHGWAKKESCFALKSILDFHLVVQESTYFRRHSRRWERRRQGLIHRRRIPRVLWRRNWRHRHYRTRTWPRRSRTSQHGYGHNIPWAPLGSTPPTIPNQRGSGCRDLLTGTRPSRAVHPNLLDTHR